MSVRKEWEKIQRDSLLLKKCHKTSRNFAISFSDNASKSGEIIGFSSDEEEEGEGKDRLRQKPSVKKRRKLFDFKDTHDFSDLMEIESGSPADIRDIQWEDGSNDSPHLLSSEDEQMKRTQQDCNAPDSPIDDFASSDDQEQQGIGGCHSGVIKQMTEESTVKRTLMKMSKTPIDSAKKKKRLKHVKSGLAERAKQLMRREKSDLAFWHHKSHKADDDESEGVVVEVVDMYEDCGLTLTQCQQLGGPVVIPGGGGGNKTLCQPNLVNIIVTLHTKRRLKLDKGSRFVIYPPWQQIFVPWPVILCAYHCKPSSSFIPSSESGSLVVPRKKVLELSTVKFNFESPQAVGGLSECVLPYSVHESVMAHGGPIAEGVSLCGIVQRICRKWISFPSQHFLTSKMWSTHVMENLKEKLQVDQKRWTLIVQDWQGVCCEIILPEQYDVQDKEKTTWLCPGKCFLFHCLCVVERKSVLSAGASSFFDSLRSCQRHFYVLTWSQHPVSIHPLSDSLLGNSARRPSLSYVDHTPLSRESSLMCRVSMVRAKVISCCQDLSHLYVCLPGDDDGSRVLCHVSRSKNCVVPFLGSGVFLNIKDALLMSFNRDGFMYMLADEFTAIEMVDTTVTELKETGKFKDPEIPQINASVSEWSLVSLSGHISKIDASTAFIWPVCTGCAGDCLEEDSTSKAFYCTACGKATSSPDTAVQLHVYVHNPSFPSSLTVKVQLLQSTIKRLLKGNLPCFDLPIQEYETEKVLGQQLSSMSCLVKRITRDSSGKEIFLEEIK